MLVKITYWSGKGKPHENATRHEVRYRETVMGERISTEDFWLLEIEGRIEELKNVLGIQSRCGWVVTPNVTIVEVHGREIISGYIEGTCDFELYDFSDCY